MNGKPVDLPPGTRIGSRTVTGAAPRDPNTTHTSVMVRCDCGYERPVFAHSLTKPKPVLMCLPCVNRARQEARRAAKQEASA